MSRQADKMMERASTRGSGGETLISQIDKMLPQIGRAISNAITPEMLARTVQTEIRKVPKLANCTKESFFGALFDCAQLGLMPGPLGHVFLIPYGQECTLVIGYKGLLELVYRSPRIESIETYIVYEGDEFEQIMGLNPDLIHRPCKNPAERGDVTHAYAVCRIKDMATPRFEVMTRGEIDAIMNRSAAARRGDSPWKTDYTEMARKTVLRRLCKTLPLSTDIHDAINRDERVSHAVQIDNEVIVHDAGSIYDRPAIEEDSQEPQEKAKKEKPKRERRERKPKEAASKPEPQEHVDENTGEITEEGQSNEDLFSKPE